MEAPNELYSSPSSMEPMMPRTSWQLLDDLSCEILLKSGELSGQIPAPINRRLIAALVREMNSYYSNLIEGHRTLPREIEAALRKDYSANAAERANQHLARAHIEAEEAMRQRLAENPDLSVHSAGFITWLHQEFYRRLPEELRYVKDANDKPYPIHPGRLRDFEVSVGDHQPPYSKELPRFLERIERVYGDPQIPASAQLIALAAAHHRLAWVHPFGDGNGRVSRLYSQAWLIRREVDGSGLWTLSRGLARRRNEYYRKLRGADQQRVGALDGRGNLTDKGLADFCLFFLKVMLDQIAFMGELLQLPLLVARIEKHLQIDLAHLGGREQTRLGRLLKAALFEGEIERGRVGEIVGLKTVAAREIIRLALKEKLLSSRSEKTALSLVFSSRNLETYFPRLYQVAAAPTDE